MFINLKVLDTESGRYFETEAVLIGDGCAVYDDGGRLTMVRMNEDDYEMETKKLAEIFDMDPSIIDKMSEMAAEDYLELCE